MENINQEGHCCSWFGHKSKITLAITIFVIVLAVFFGIKALGEMLNLSYYNYDKVPHNTISFTGKGEVVSIPNTTNFTFSVVESASTVAKAQEQATTIINKAYALIKAAGVKEGDIKTVGYNIYPKYDYVNYLCKYNVCPSGKRVLTGYEVSQTLSVKVRDISKAGDLLSGIGELGVSNVSGLEFTVDNEDALKAQARKMAIDDAKSKAKTLANDLGVRIVEVVSFSEDGVYPIYYGKSYDNAASSVMAESAPAPVVPAGENTITSNVTITYEIR